jgi:hypothetical protein
MRRVKHVRIGSEWGKYCTHCTTLKPLSEFYVNKKTSDGLQSWCKDCIKGDPNTGRAARARNEAVRRLIKAHPEEYRKLYEEERDR